jgi:hypothetical protein
LPVNNLMSMIDKLQIRQKNILLFCLFLFFNLGCANNKFQQQERALNELLASVDNNHVSLGSGIYVVSPLDGCSPCIGKLLKFASTKKELTLVLSGKGEKQIRLAVSSLGVDLDNYFTDTKEYARRLGLITTYPCIFYCKDNKVTNITEINPDNFSEEIKLLAD